MKTVKFIQTLSVKVLKELKEEANKRGIEVQEYIRAVIIPEHLHHLKFLPIPEKKYSQRAKKAWATRRLKKYNKEFVKDESHEVPAIATLPHEDWEEKRPDL